MLNLNHLWKSANTLIPLIICVVLLVFSFAPVPQIFFLYGNSAILFLFEGFFDDFNSPYLDAIGLILAFLFLLAYYFARYLVLKILWALLTVIVLHGVIYSLEMEFTAGGDTTPYYLGFIIIAIFSTLPILIVGLIKDRKRTSAIK